MASQTETWYYIKDGILWQHTENDGYSAMRRGLEPKETPLCAIEDAEQKYPWELKRAFESENY